MPLLNIKFKNLLLAYETDQKQLLLTWNPSSISILPLTGYAPSVKSGWYSHHNRTLNHKLDSSPLLSPAGGMTYPTPFDPQNLSLP